MEDLQEEVAAALERLWRLRWRPGPVAEADGRPVHGAEWRCLWAIRRHGPLANRDLAAVLGVGAPAASLTVRRLMDLGLVEQSPDPGDRRRILIRVAPAGEKLLEEARQARQSQVMERLKRLSPEELTLLHRILGKLIGEEEGPRPPA